MSNPTAIRSLAVLSLSLSLSFSLAACAIDGSDEEVLDETGEVEEVDITDLEEADVELIAGHEPGALASPDPGDVFEPQGYCPGCANCVYRARCLQPRLPLGLTTWADKRSKINSQVARVGCVAMIYTGSQWGHVAYVADKHADGTITIREGNWIGNTCSSRRRTPGALNVRGYWCP